MTKKLFFRRLLIYGLYIIAITPPILFFVQIFVLGPRLPSANEGFDLSSYPPGAPMFFICLLGLSALQLMYEMKLSRKLLSDVELPRSFITLSLVVLIFCFIAGMWVMNNFLNTLIYPLAT